MDVRSQLLSISSIASQKDRPQEYRSILLENILANQDDPAVLQQNLKTFIDVIIQEQVGVVISRQVLTDFCNSIDRIKDEEVKAEILKFSVEKIQPRVVSFEEQVRINDNIMDQKRF